MAQPSRTRVTERDGSTATSRRGVLRAAWSDEMAAAHSARARRDVTGEWKHLERAHILSQPMAGAHVRTHLAMLALRVPATRPSRDHRAGSAAHHGGTRLVDRALPGW
jgi:Protein of unknown function (DUF3703)